MSDFDAAMLARLRSSDTEAARVVLDLVKSGRKMPDAIHDAVESLPWTDTVALRRWTENWQAWLDWQRWHAAGWSVSKITRRRVLVDVPENKWRDLAHALRRVMDDGHTSALIRSGHIPPEDAVAAAGDVAEVARPVLVDAPRGSQWPYVARHFGYDIKRHK